MRLPAYARALLDLRRQGKSPTNSVCIALDWEIAKGYPWRLVVPPSKAVSSIDFSLVAGLDVLLRGNDISRMHEVARRLLELPLARLVGVCPPSIIVYWPGDASKQ